MRRRCSLLLASIPLLLAMLFSHVVAAQQTPLPRRFDFQGNLLVVACDTDMLPSAYIDGKLGPEAGHDALAVIQLGAPSPARMSVATVPVSNSVAGPPNAVAVTPDGHYAIVAETIGPRPHDRPDATMKDLASGDKITVVDLHAPAKPSVTQVLSAYDRAVSVAVDASGSRVLAAFAPRSGHAAVPLVLYRFAEGKLSDPQPLKLPDFSAVDALNDAQWLPGHPDIIAVVFAPEDEAPHAKPRLQFLRLASAGGATAVEPWGDAVPLDPSPYSVRFTGDGRFALVNAMHNFANGRGTVTSIAVASKTRADGTPQHAIASRTDTGELPEGLAVSPDGHWVATANLEESYQPLADPKQSFFGSLSLLRLDPATGALTRVNDFPFDGALPEPIVFDNSSRFIASASFSRYDDPHAGGSIRFWRIEDKLPQPGRVELIELDEAVALPRGPQSMAIVR